MTYDVKYEEVMIPIHNKMKQKPSLFLFHLEIWKYYLNYAFILLAKWHHENQPNGIIKTSQMT